jgi:NAD(P)-dependent dehydrogenase (short-subunit alcohol dehydrogenase family)
MATEVSGDVAVVTGAGRGLGRAYALELGRRMAKVVVNDMASAEADAVVEEIVRAGGQSVAVCASVATPAGGQAIIDAAVEAFGTVDIVVNNAGFLRPGYFEDLTPDRIDDVLEVHLRGAFSVTQPAWRIMKEKGYGRVVLTSSSSGLFSHHGLSSYAAAKAGLYGLTKALAFEGRDHGVKVNAVLPYARTTITANDPVPDLDDVWAAAMPAGVSRASIPAARQDPAVVAPLITYLVSRGCEVTGEAFSACAGRFARVFVGVAEGWLAPAAATVSAEDLEEHLDAIRDTSRASIPRWMFDEWADVAKRVAEL